VLILWWNRRHFVDLNQTFDQEVKMEEPRPKTQIKRVYEPVAGSTSSNQPSLVVEKLTG